MRILGIMFCSMFLLMFLFAKITWGDSSDLNIIKRAIASLMGSFILTVVLGLPVLGLIYLITN